MAPCDEVNLCVSNATSPAKMVNSEGVVSEVASEKLQKGQSPNMKIEGLESNKEVSMPSIISQKTSQGPNNEDIEMQSDKVLVSSVKPEKVSQSSCTGALALLPGQEGRTGHEVSIHSVVRASDDGYNWRKYGQKNVKGNEYIRSYYKCTYRTCQVKRQVERSHDGQITDIVYFGQHDHPKPQANLPLAVGFVVSIVEDRSSEPSVTSADKLCNVDVKTPKKIEHTAVATSENAKSVLSQSNRRRDEIDKNGAPYSKRQKKDNLDAKSVDKSTAEQRVVKTVSEVDSVNDGYRWRKYGQKQVKGNPNPRSYYRCSSPGCPAKKHVERASHDPKMVISTYEGQHGHEIPPGRTITHNTAGQNNQTVVAMDGETDTKSRENNTVCLDMVVHAGSDPHGKPPGSTGARNTVEENNQTSLQAGESGTEARESVTVTKLDEQRNGESGSKSEVCDVVSPNVAVQSSLDSGSRSNKEKNIESGAKSEEMDTSGLDAEGPEGRSNGQSRTEPEDGNNVQDMVVHVTPGPASISKEQQMPNVEAVPMEKLVKVVQTDDVE